MKTTTAKKPKPKPVNAQQRSVFSSRTLLSWLLSSGTVSQSVVVSLFAGTGSDLVAGIQHGHHVIGMDKSTDMVSINA